MRPWTIGHRAASSALEANAQIALMRTEVGQRLDETTAEITRLVGSDAAQSKQLETFERALSEATRRASDAIEKRGEAAALVIQTEIGAAGDKVTRRVVIPVAMIAALASVVQALRQGLRHRRLQAGRDRPQPVTAR